MMCGVVSMRGLTTPAKKGQQQLNGENNFALAA